jgi:hypothetical protein
MRMIEGVVEVDGKKVKRKILLEDRLCDVCGNKYEPYTQDARCCSKKCYRKALSIKNSIRTKEARKKSYERNKNEILAHNKKWYQSHQEERKTYRREYYRKNKERILDQVSEYSDLVRHGGERSKLIKKHGHVCYMCGCESERIVAHHVTLNKEDHEHQVLLCLSCHAKLHAMIKWHSR